MHVDNIIINKVETVEELRNATVIALRRLVHQINNSKQTSPIDANDNRIVNVGAPGALTDAVNLQTLNKAIEGLSSSRGGGSTISSTVNITGSGIYVIDQTLTANITDITIPGGAVSQLTVIILRQNGTGGWTMTWDNTKFIGTSGMTIGLGANEISIFLFYATSTSLLTLVAPPILGLT